MKGYIKAIILILAGLAILIPFASSYPDGLEKVAETLKVEEMEPFWKGPMPDYSLPTIENQYLSTLGAGFCGVLIVLTASFVLGTAASKPE
ncbi:MAG: PDGLE domain-containing protein [Candidatus Bathyarchaeia archaeon]